MPKLVVEKNDNGDRAPLKNGDKINKVFTLRIAIIVGSGGQGPPEMPGAG